MTVKRNESTAPSRGVVEVGGLGRAQHRDLRAEDVVDAPCERFGGPRRVRPQRCFRRGRVQSLLSHLPPLRTIVLPCMHTIRIILSSKC